MCTAAEIEGLLTELDHCSADDLEDQDLDFKQWDAHSRDKAVKLVVQMFAAPSRSRDGPPARLCQRTEPQMREHLANMERVSYIEHGGSGRGAYWTLHPALHRRLAEPGHPERDRRIDWEAAKARVLSILMERARRGENRLSNKEIRQIAHFDRNQVTRLMAELRHDHPQVKSTGHGAGAGNTWSGSE